MFSPRPRGGRRKVGGRRKRTTRYGEREEGASIGMVSESRQKKSLDSPDETRTFENGKAQITTLGDFSASRLVLEPGWGRAEQVKPIAATGTRPAVHTG